MRLIDADALSKKLLEELHNRSMQGFGKGLMIANSCVINAPTIEQKRETGEWIPYTYVDPYDWYQDKEIRYRCSKCGVDVIDKSNFCPNCGADMGKRKGGKNENQSERNNKS